MVQSKSHTDDTFGPNLIRSVRSLDDSHLTNAHAHDDAFNKPATPQAG